MTSQSPGETIMVTAVTTLWVAGVALYVMVGGFAATSIAGVLLGLALVLAARR